MNSISRFFVTKDPRLTRLVLELPKHWWSRFYEYAWCRTFAVPGATVLDAACGISHPFKFHLADVCSTVHACDIDERIVYDDAILADIEVDFGAFAAQLLPRRYLRAVKRTVANIGKLPYDGASFDTVFCISTLEHLPSETLGDALAEFYRVLKPNGSLVLTFDHPTIDIGLILRVLEQVGLKPAAEVRVDVPKDALFSKEHNLRCFRLLLKRA